MAKRDKSRGFLHIKKRTEGTSNELSFSVLDAKSKDADIPDNSPRTVSGLGKVSVFTVPDKQTGEPAPSASGFGMSRKHKAAQSFAVSGTTTLSPQTEIAHRKRHRRITRLFQVLGILALVGILGVAAYQYAKPLLEKSNVSHEAVDAAIDLLAQTDETILALDSAVTQPAQSSNTILKQQLADLAAAASLLDRALNAAEQVISADPESNHATLAAEAKESAQARKKLIETGRVVLTQAAGAKRAVDLAEQSWDITLEGDKFARQAFGMLEDNPNYEESSALYTEAIAQFQEALVLLRRAAVAYDQADFSQYKQYLETRLAAAHNAISANAALEAGKEELATVNLMAYNAADEEAASIAAQLPESPAQPVVDAYSHTGGNADASYQEARQRASRAETVLRDYLDNRE